MDPSLYWNDVALETNRERHTNKAKEQSRPPLSALALAIVHLAMYDTYAGVSGNPWNLPANLPELPLAPAGVSTTAAVAGAAHATLLSLYPTHKATFDLKMAQAPITGNPVEVSNGRTSGANLAQAMLDDRSADLGVSHSGYTPSMALGGPRLDPENPAQGDLKRLQAVRT